MYWCNCSQVMSRCRVARQQEINQMSAANLGIIFGPTLLRPRYLYIFSPDCLLLAFCNWRRWFQLMIVQSSARSNLSVCYDRQGASSLNYLIETPFQTRIVELLINNVEVSVCLQSAGILLLCVVNCYLSSLYCITPYIPGPCLVLVIAVASAWMMSCVLPCRSHDRLLQHIRGFLQECAIQIHIWHYRCEWACLCSWLWSCPGCIWCHWGTSCLWWTSLRHDCSLISR